MGSARAPTAASGVWPAWIWRVSKDQPSFMGSSWVWRASSDAGAGGPRGGQRGSGGRRRTPGRDALVGARGGLVGPRVPVAPVGSAPALTAGAAGNDDDGERV